MKHQESQQRIRKTVRKSLQSICVYKAKRKGLTLIEVIISLAIFALISIPIAGFVNTSIKLNKNAEVKQQATLLGQSILEELGGIDELIIGENNALFGQTELIVQTCSESNYCIEDLILDDMEVNMEFYPLLVSETDEAAAKANSDPYKDVGLTIDVQNTGVTIENKDSQKSTSFSNGGRILYVQLNSKNEVIVSRPMPETSPSTEDDGDDGNLGKLVRGNIRVHVQNNNNHLNSLGSVNFTNESKSPLNACVENPNGNGHEDVALFTDSKNVLLSMADKNQSCKFNSNTLIPPDGGNDMQPEIPEVPVIPEIPETGGSNQVTETQDLYEVSLNIYDIKSNDILFAGNRVLPLSFKDEDTR